MYQLYFSWASCENFYKNGLTIATIEKIAERYKEVIDKGIISVLHDKLIFVKNHFNSKYSRDPDDDKFINCARSAGAYYIVTVSEFLKFKN